MAPMDGLLLISSSSVSLIGVSLVKEIKTHLIFCMHQIEGPSIVWRDFLALDETYSKVPHLPIYAPFTPAHLPIYHHLTSTCHL